MSDLFTRLAELALGTASIVYPETAPRFAQGNDIAPDLSRESLWNPQPQPQGHTPSSGDSRVELHTQACRTAEQRFAKHDAAEPHLAEPHASERIKAKTNVPQPPGATVPPGERLEQIHRSTPEAQSSHTSAPLHAATKPHIAPDESEPPRPSAVTEVGAPESASASLHLPGPELSEWVTAKRLKLNVEPEPPAQGSPPEERLHTGEVAITRASRSQAKQPRDTRPQETPSHEGWPAASKRREVQPPEGRPGESARLETPSQPVQLSSGREPNRKSSPPAEVVGRMSIESSAAFVFATHENVAGTPSSKLSEPSDGAERGRALGQLVKVGDEHTSNQRAEPPENVALADIPSQSPALAPARQSSYLGEPPSVVNIDLVGAGGRIESGAGSHVRHMIQTGNPTRPDVQHARLRTWDEFPDRAGEHPCANPPARPQQHQPSNSHANQADMIRFASASTPRAVVSSQAPTPNESRRDEVRAQILTELSGPRTQVDEGRVQITEPRATAPGVVPESLAVTQQAEATAALAHMPAQPQQPSRVTLAHERPSPDVPHSTDAQPSTHAHPSATTAAQAEQTNADAFSDLGVEKIATQPPEEESRRTTRAAPWAPLPASSAAVVRVHIGRIEVRAVAPSPSPATPPEKKPHPRPQLSLGEYLKKRKEGGR